MFLTIFLHLERCTLVFEIILKQLLLVIYDSMALLRRKLFACLEIQDQFSQGNNYIKLPLTNLHLNVRLKKYICFL